MLRRGPICGLLVTAWWLGCTCGERPPDPPAPAPAPAPIADASTPVDAGPSQAAVQEEPGAVVRVRIGKVEVRRKKRTDWSPLDVGDKVASEDAIRTGEDANVEMSVDDVSVKLHESSEAELGAVTRSSVRAKVKGHVESRVADGKGKIELESADTGAVVRSEGGHFSMMSDGRSVVAVGTVEGRVSLGSAGVEVDIPTGMVGRASAGKRPEQPTAALAQVLLAVQWPKKKVTKDRLVAITGRVEPGSRVVVQGVTVRADEKGRFRAKVPLREGEQPVSVRVVDPLGRRTTLAEKFVRDTRKPGVRKDNKLWQ